MGSAASEREEKLPSESGKLARQQINNFHERSVGSRIREEEKKAVGKIQH